MLGRTSNQPGWLERCNLLVLVDVSDLARIQTDLSSLARQTSSSSPEMAALTIYIAHTDAYAIIVWATSGTLL